MLLNILILEKVASSFFQVVEQKNKQVISQVPFQFGTQNNINMISQSTYVYIVLYIIKTHFTVVISSCVHLTLRNNKNTIRGKLWILWSQEILQQLCRT